MIKMKNLNLHREYKNLHPLDVIEQLRNAIAYVSKNHEFKHKWDLEIIIIKRDDNSGF